MGKIQIETQGKTENKRPDAIATPYVAIFKKYLKEHSKEGNRRLIRKRDVVEQFIKLNKRKDKGVEKNKRAFQKRMYELVRPRSNVYLNDLFFFCKLFDITPNEILGEKEKPEPESYTVYDNYFIYFTEKELKTLCAAIEKKYDEMNLMFNKQFVIPIIYHVPTGCTMYCHFILEEKFEIQYVSSFYDNNEFLYRLDRKFYRPRKMNHLYFKKLDTLSYQKAETLFMEDCEKDYGVYIDDLQGVLKFISNTEEVKTLINNNKFFHDLYRHKRRY